MSSRTFLLAGVLWLVSFPIRAEAAPAWDLTWDGGDSEAAHGLAVDSSGRIFTTGNSGSNINVIGLSSAGAVVSTWTFNSGNSDAAWGMWLDASGNAYAAGQTFNGSNNDFRFVKFTSTGGLALTGSYDSGGTDLAWGVVGAADGSFVVGGTVGLDMRLIKYTSTGAVVWSKAYDSGLTDGLLALTGDASGYVYAAGYHDNGGDDVKTIKFDPAGSIVWISTYSGGQLERARGVTVDSSGNVYVVGYSGNDFLLLKYGPSGTLAWSRTWDSGKNDNGYAVTVDAQGRVFAAGFSEESGAVSNDFRLWRYDPDGTLVGTTLYSDPGVNAEARGVAVDDQGAVYVGGLGNGSDYRVLRDSYVYTPSLSAAAFSGVFASSLSANWLTGFPGGTLYYAQASTGSDFSALAASTLTTALTMSFSGLNANATYYARVSTALGGPYTSLGSTITLSAVPALTEVVSVTTVSVRFAWGLNGNPPDTEFQASVSTMPTFVPETPGSWAVGATTVTVSGLTPYTTYYLHVRAKNRAGTPTGFDLAVATRTDPRPIEFITAWTGRNDGYGFITAAWGDYDNDGFADFAGAANAPFGYRNKVFHNNGDGTFTDVWTSTQAESTYAVAWGDYDNDGDLDLAFGNNTPSGEPNVRLYRNDGGGAFPLVWVSTETDDAVQLRWGDYDNDGRLDLLAVNDAFFSPSRTRVYRNLGGGAFQSVWSASEANGFRSGAWGDFDGDGRLDLALTGDYAGSLRVYRNQGDSFAPFWVATTTFNGAAVLWADVDQDGRLDLLGLGGNSYTLSYYRFDGSTFTHASAMSSTLNSRLALADVDGDGDLDAATHLIGSGGQGGETVVKNAGAGAFSQVWASTFGFSGQGMVDYADMDGDGRPDLLGIDCCSHPQPNIRVFRNVSPGLSAPPLAPSTFASYYDSASHVLSIHWDAGAAPGLPPDALAYSIRVGTSPGGTNILSDAAPTSVGSFQHSGRLASGLLGVEVRTDLPQGTTLYWSVRSVSPSGRVSASSNEQSMVVQPSTNPSFIPLSVPFTAVSSAAVEVAWWSDFPAGTTFYAQLSTGADFTGVVLDSVTRQAWTAFDSLAPNTKYFARVATAPGGAFAFIGSTATLIETPDRISLVPEAGGVVAAPLPLSSFSNPGVGLTATRVAIDGSYSGWSTAGSTQAFPGLTPNSNHTFAAQARNQDGVATDAVYASTYTLAVASQPVGGGSFISAVYPASMTVTWSSGSAASGFNAAGATYLLEASSTSSFSLTTATAKLSALSVSIQGLGLPGTTYYFRVKALNSVGAAGDWLVLGSTLQSNPGALTPAGFSGIGTSSASVSWDSTFPVVPSFFLDLSTSSGFGGALVSISTPVATANVSGLSPGTRYYVRVATSADGPFAALGNVDTRTAVPANIQVLSVSSTSATVGWSTQGNAGSILYEASRSTSSDFYPATAGPLYSTPTATFNNLSSLTTYYFRVRSRNIDGSWSDYDSAVSTFTPARPADFLLAWSQTSGGTYGAGAAAWGDYDGDGLLDFAVSARAPNYGDANKVYRNDGNGSFSAVWVSTQAEESWGVAWGDYDNDGDLDLAYGNAGASEPSIRLYRNDAGGLFTLVWVATETNRNLSLRWGDYDNDGKIDLLAVNSVYYGAPYAMLYRNLGDGRFSRVWAPTEGESISDAVWGDYDDDGRLDILAGGGWGTGHTRIYRNTGSGFSPVWVATSASLGRTVAWADVDRDGHLDFMALDGSTSYLLRYFRFDGSTFTLASAATVGIDSFLTLADVDGDGDLDVGTQLDGSGGGGANRVFLNDGTGRFAPVWSAAEGFGGSGSADLGDMDGDGLPDLVATTCCTSYPKPRVYRNHSPATNAPPSPPSAGFTATYDATGHVLSLRWSPGSDAETPAAGLRYAVRAGTAPGSSNILSDAMPPTVGSFQHPQKVSFGQLGVDVDVSLPVGTTIYWSVRTLDGGTSRSSAGPEQPFLVLPATTGLTSAQFGEIFASSLTANWNSNSPGGTLYYAQLSTDSAFSTLASSTLTTALTMPFTGLSANTTYYARVSTSLAGPFTSLGSTITLVQEPTAIVFEEVSTTTLVAAAYSPTPAFSNLNAGLSGTNIAKDGVWAGWHGESWTAKASLPAARYALAAAAAGGKLYALGGWTFTSVTTNTEYDPLTNAWTSKAAMPAAASSLAAAALDGAVYVVGGENTGGQLSGNRRYDPAANAWTTEASLPSSRAGMGLAVLGRTLLSLGGLGSSGYIASVSAYDADAGSWSSRASLPGINHAMAAVEAGGRVYSLGGYDGAYISSAARYDPGLGSWSAVSSAPIGVAYPAYGVIGGKVYLFGGSDPAGAIAATQEYDPAQDAWTLRAGMPTARGRAAGAVIAGRAYVVGGTNGSTLATHEAYDAGTARQFTGLTPNTQYTFTAKARNAAGTETGTVTASTYTAAAPPSGSAFTMVGASSLTLSWSLNGNPAGTEFQASISTLSSFAAEAAGAWTAGQSSAVFSGLDYATTYYARVRARNAVGAATEYDAVQSTRTRAVVTEAASPSFLGVAQSSLVVQWGVSDPGAGATFYTRLSTAPDFTGTLLSSVTKNLSAVFAGLSANTSYYAQAAAGANGVYAFLGSTITLVQEPTAIVFEEVSTTTLVAAAYSPTPAFSNLNAGLSGTNIAKDGVWAGWHGESWTAKASLPAARYALAAAAAGGRLYALGGWTFTSVTTNTEYDPLTNAWTSKAAMPAAASSLAAAALDGAVYVVGGEDTGGQLAGNRRYDPAANAWTTEASLPSSRAGVGLAVLGRTLLSLGGLGSSGYIASASAYDADAGAWSSRASLPGINHAMAAVEAGGRVYSLGGYDGAYISSAARYDPGLDSWSAVSSAPIGVAYPAYGVIGGKVYLFGGSDPAGAIAATQEYDPAQDAWTLRAGMPTARGRAAGAVIAGRAYVVGGTNGSTLATHEAYDAGTARQFTGLTPNTQYTFTAKARNAAGTETGTVTASTYTAAAPPSASTTTLGQVYVTSAAVQWAANGNPGLTEYRVSASTAADFNAAAASALTAWSASVNAAVTGLSANTTWYFRVKARNAVGVETDYISLGSTVTLIEPPTALVFDDISSTTLVASAYSPTPAFTNLDKGLSGTNIAQAGVFAGWHGSTWTARTPAAYINRSGMVVSGNKAYSFGGDNAAFQSQVYDPVADSWGTTAAMPTPRGFPAVVAVAGKVYVMGGYNPVGGALLTAGPNEVFDPESNSWTTLARVPTARLAAAAQAVGDRIYLIGGGTPGSTLVNEAYDVLTGSWTSLAPIPAANNSAGSAVMRGKIYIFGGGSGSANLTQIYDPGSNSWSSGANLPTGRSEFGGAALGGKFYAIGGTDGAALAVSEEYDPSADAWTARPSLPTKLWGGAAVGWGGRIHVVGVDRVQGTNQFNYRFDPGTSQMFGGLSPNTQYAFTAKARNAAGTETGTVTASTYTAAAPPSGSAFTMVGASSLTLSWSLNGNPAGTEFQASISTLSSFAAEAAGAWTAGQSSATFTGLDQFSIYYARVRARNAVGAATGYDAAASTVTRGIPPPGCAEALFVVKNGLGDCTSVQACVDRVPTSPLGGDFCVAVMDAGVYSEAVVVSGKDPNGHALKVLGAGPARPTLTPPAGASAGFRVMNASVSVSDINIVSTNTVAYGVLVSSPGVAVSSMVVDSGGKIGTAGISAAGWTSISNASVTVQLAHGIQLTGSSNMVSGSSASATGAAKHALYVNGGSSNTVTRLYTAALTGFGAFLNGSSWNTLQGSTFTSANSSYQGLRLTASSSNAVSGCVITNTAGDGAEFFGGSDFNTLDASTVAASGASRTALVLSSAKGNTVSRSFIWAPAGSGAAAASGAELNLFSEDVVVGGAAGFYALSFTGSSNTVTDSFLLAPNGIALGLSGVSASVVRSTVVGGSGSYAALHAEGASSGTVTLSSIHNPAGQGALLRTSVGLTISLSTVTGGGGLAALAYEGASSVTVSGSRIVSDGPAVVIGTYFNGFDSSTTTGTAGALNATSVEGTTGVQFLAGPYVSTFTGLSFDAAVSVNVDGTGLGAGSSILMLDAAGSRAGPAFETDPDRVVHWSGAGYPALAAPAAPQGTALDTSSIAWTWAAVTGAYRYDVVSASSGTVLARLSTQAFVQAGLTPNTGYGIRAAAVGADEGLSLSPSATAYTFAAPPSGTAVSAVYATSATLAWGLNGNPAGSIAEVQGSTDSAAYASVFTSTGSVFSPAGLQGCSTYYYRVRHRGFGGDLSAFDAVASFSTLPSTPLPAGSFAATSLAGALIRLEWVASPDPKLTGYRLYSDGGTGTVDYAAPLAALAASATTTTVGPLSNGVLYRFALRALNSCGREEGGLGAVAGAPALATLSGVRAAIKEPASGKKISGNRVLVMAELVSGEPERTRQVLFQYRASSAAAWTDIPAANLEHPNPDSSFPYFVHWDVSALADTDYDLRAVATDVFGTVDSAPGVAAVAVDSVNFEVRETDQGGGRVKKEQTVNNAVPNTVAAAEAGSNVVTKVMIPAGAVSVSTTVVTVAVNPAGAPAQDAAFTSVGAVLQVDLGNGQHQLDGGQTAALVFNYPDGDGDGVVDGTTLRAGKLQIVTYDAAAGKWKQEFGATVDETARTVTGQTPHFSFFSLIGTVTSNLTTVRVYPNPWKPNGGNTDEGKPYNPADATSGVIFDNLPASVRVTIYTLTGSEVESFGTDSGTGTLQWDGKNSSGQDVASGGYFAVIKSPGAEPVVVKFGVIR